MHALSAAGASALVAVIYLVIVASLGKLPGNDAERELLGLAMLAAALAAIGYLLARRRSRPDSCTEPGRPRTKRSARSAAG